MRDSRRGTHTSVYNCQIDFSQRGKNKTRKEAAVEVVVHRMGLGFNLFLVEAREEATSHSGGPAELTPHTTSTTRQPSNTHYTRQTSDKGMASVGYPVTPDSCLCGVQGVAREGCPAAPAARRGHPAGHCFSLTITLWGFGVNPPRLSRSAKPRVLPERPRSSLYRRLPRPPF